MDIKLLELPKEDYEKCLKRVNAFKELKNKNYEIDNNGMVLQLINN